MQTRYTLCLGGTVSVVFIASVLRYTARVHVISHAYSTGDNSKCSQPWNKKENMRSKGSESGKHCTLACISHVASGVKNGQVAPPFAECLTLSYFRRRVSSSLGLFTAYVASWLAAYRAFRSQVLLFLIHRCELRTTCNSFTVVTSAVCARYNADVITPTRDAQCSTLSMQTTLKLHLRISPYKGSVATIHIQMPFHAVGQSFWRLISS